METLDKHFRTLTKAAFAYMVLQLIDEGKINPDASIATYLPKPLPEYEDYADLAGDERWRALTPRVILNHTTGFANFRWLEDDQSAETKDWVQKQNIVTFGYLGQIPYRDKIRKRLAMKERAI